MTVRLASDDASRTVMLDPLEPLEERTPPAGPDEERDRSPSESRAYDPTQSLTALADASLPDSLADSVRSEPVRDWVADMLVRLVYDNPNNFADSSTNWEKTAVQIEGLYYRLTKERGRHPDSAEGYTLRGQDWHIFKALELMNE
jgi:hypothetical protein